MKRGMKKLVLAVLMLGLSYSNVHAGWVLTHERKEYSGGVTRRIEALGSYSTATACLKARTVAIDNTVHLYAFHPIRVEVNENYIFSDDGFGSKIDKFFCIKE